MPLSIISSAAAVPGPSRRWTSRATATAAQKVMASKASGSSRGQVDAAQLEDDLQSTLDSLRKAGQIGVITASKAKSEVRPPPQMHLSQRLAHAADLALKEKSNGYQLTGGVRPRSTLSKRALDTLEKLRG